MKTITYVPSSLREAAMELRLAFSHRLEQLPKNQFIRAWSSVAYIFPGLHPDGYEEADSGWPQALRRFAAEAWRREDVGELADAELYPCDAQWCGLYDRMHTHFPEETERRLQLEDCSKNQKLKEAL